MFQRGLLIIVFSFTTTIKSYGQNNNFSQSNDQIDHNLTKNEIPSRWSPWNFELRKKINKPRSYFWAPLMNLGVPGLDQWIEGQVGAGFMYLGIGIAGLGIVKGANLTEEDVNFDAEDLNEIPNRVLWATFGSKLYQSSLSLSVHHSFMTAVKSHKNNGLNTFDFIKVEETPDELMLAPFDFSLLKRKTTFIPLAVLTGLLLTGANEWTNDFITVENEAIFSGISYMAGVEEESLFRGFIHPALRTKWSPFWSNTTQAALFGAAHYSKSNRFPLAQGLAGYYLGWVAQKNNFGLKESIFIHAWWDFLIFTSALLSTNKNEQNVNLQLINVTF